MLQDNNSSNFFLIVDLGNLEYINLTRTGEGTHASKASENPTTEVPSVDSESIHDDTLEESIKKNELLNEENEDEVDDEQNDDQIYVDIEDEKYVNFVIINNTIFIFMY